MLRATIFVLLLLALTAACLADDKGKASNDKKAKKKKRLQDYNERDLEALYAQWEEEEERDDPDNYPPKPKPVQFDPSKLSGDKSNVEAMLQNSQKGKTLMVFVSVSDSPTQRETERLTGKWEEMLRNGGILIQRFVISEDRAIFMLQDGSEAWKMKDFLIEQEGCEVVEIEQKKYPGKKPHRINKDEL